MKNRLLHYLFIACPFLFLSATGNAQKSTQILDYLKRNIRIFYLANPNIPTPDFREIKPATIAGADNKIVFGTTDNNDMDNCAQLLLTLFREKDGDLQFQRSVYAAMQISKKPIVINFINDVSTGINTAFLPLFNFYVVDVGGKTVVWPASYPNSGSFGTGSVTAIVLGESSSGDLPRSKRTFIHLVSKLSAGEHGPAMTGKFPSGLNSYHIVSAVGNKFLTVKDANPGDGALLEIRDFTGKEFLVPSANQVWTLQEFGFGQRYYFIKSRQGKVMDLKNNITTNGADVQMWSLWGTPNQRWQLVDAGGGYFHIKNVKSGKVLDVSGAVNENGRKVWNYERNSSVSQKWKFVKTTGPNVDQLLTGEPTVCEKPYTFFDKEIDIKSAGIGYCPQKQDEWESVVTQQLGISAKNRTNHYIGWSAAKKPGLIVGDVAGRNWYPIAEVKKVHVGKLCKVGYFDAVAETKTGKSWLVDREEKDFNLHVIPNPPFSYQIEKSIIGYDPSIEFAGFYDCDDNWLKCGDTFVMEGEITPDDAFIANSNNQWLGNKNQDGNSELFLNQNIGMYGPWINEEVHCNHPEIHPVEMLWSETTDPNVKYLCIFQDDSHRFGYYANFPDYSEPKDLDDMLHTSKTKKDLATALRTVHPWAISPISGQFFVAFQIDLAAGTKQSYTINVETSRQVVTSTLPSSIPAIEYAGKTRVIKNNGVEVFKVTELQDNENDIGIRFELFKKKDSNIILGYMVISAAVSKDLDGNEGYMVIRLKKSN